MKILFAADGSKFTKKALAFLVTHEKILDQDSELIVVHVQAPLPPRVKSMVGAKTVSDYHSEEAGKVLNPIKRLLERHGLRHRASWVIGASAVEILRAAGKEKAQLIVMGTHGHGLVGRALMGSVAQRVLTEAEVPVLLVK